MKTFILILFAIFVAAQFSYAQWTTSGNNYTTGYVGIGTTTPANPLHISQAAAGTTLSYIRLDGQAEAPNLYLKVGSDGNHNGAAISITTYGRIGGAEDLRFETANWGGEYTWGYLSQSAGTKVVADLGTSGSGNTGGYDYGKFTLYSVSDAQGGYYNSTGLSSGTPLVHLDANSSNTTYFNAGNVAIGTTNAYGYKLAINGNAIATAMTVKVYTAWPDYVFNTNYSLPSLNTLKTYIDQNHHLPGMPTESEVYKSGLNLGEMDKTLVKKMEELTLYLINKDDQLKADEGKIQAQAEENNGLKQQVDLLKQEIESLTKQMNAINKRLTDISKEQ